MIDLPRRAAAIVVCALAVTAAGCTGASEPPMAAGQGADRQCFLPRTVNGFTPRGDDRVLVHVGARQVYELELVGTCPSVDWSNRIGIRSRGGGSWICQGFDADLVVPAPSGVEQCPVTNIRRLSEQEVLAWRESRRRR